MEGASHVLCSLQFQEGDSQMRRYLKALLVLSVALTVHSFAQDAPKFEVFGGYSWYNPGGRITTTPSLVDTKIYDFRKGWGGQFTYNLNSWAGIALDANGHYSDFGNVHSLAIGPQFKLRQGFTPFAEAMVGWQHLGPKLYPDQNSPVYIVGGGLEYPFNPHFAVRFFQADYVKSSYTKLSPGSNNFDGVRIQGGLVFAFGVPPAEGKVSAGCSAEPTAVDAGAPVKVTVTPSGFLPKRTLSYSYSANTGTKQYWQHRYS
jgi:hypothetical protein